MKLILKTYGLFGYNDNKYDNSENYNSSLLLNAFNRESGFYQQTVYPLLVLGHEKELINWLRDKGLLKFKQICSKKMNNHTCNSTMIWEEAKGRDLFQWRCRECLKTKSIREDSIFSGLSCNFKDAIRIILSWCKGHHVDYVTNMLGVSTAATEELYARASSVAEKCIKSNLTEWQIGGPGVIVLVDTYPEGCTNTSLTRANRPILCISEIKSIPQKYWLEVLDELSNEMIHLNYLKQHVVETVQNIVRPGSIIVIPNSSTLCSRSDFQHLNILYPTIVNVEDLARHNDDHRNVFSNLEIIWKRVLDVCEEAQFHCPTYVDLFVVGHMWGTVYGDQAFERLLNQVSFMR